MSMTEDVLAPDSVRSRLEVERLRGELSTTRKHAGELERENERLRVIADYSARPLDPPKWLTPTRKPKDRTGIVCAVLSDTHFDEVVNPDEVGGFNAYSRAIAEMRLEKFFTGVEKLTSHYLQGVDYEGAVLFLGGDMISGDIHEELSQTNEGTTLETVLHWTERLAAGVAFLADTFERVNVPCVVGNHGRRTRKPRAKLRARDNFDWFIYQSLARHFSGDKRITFDIPDGTDTIVPVYGTRFLLTHGDQTGGGGGIGGIWPPLMRMRAKKQNRYDFDTMICGHWHSLIMAPTNGLIVNGSLKGYDEYAAVSNFYPERPQQALWITTPQNGVTFTAPIFVGDPVEEGWG